MTSTYTQKSDALQRIASHNAASIMDSSAQGASLQRKANIANNRCMCSAIQCGRGKDQFFPNGKDLPHFHKHKNGVTFKGLSGHHKNLSDNQRIRAGAIDEVRSMINDYFVGGEIDAARRDYLLNILTEVSLGRI